METGTGKELIARAVHDSRSRFGRSFIKLNKAQRISQRSLLPIECVPDLAAAVADAPRGHSGAGRTLRRNICPPDEQANRTHILLREAVLQSIDPAHAAPTSTSSAADLKLSQHCGGPCGAWTVANLLAILPNGANRLRVVDVLRRILFQHDEICLFPRCKRSALIFDVEQLGCV